MHSRLATVCHLFPSVSPHGAQVPESVWNLPYWVWRGLAASADEYTAAMAEQQQQRRAAQ